MVHLNIGLNAKITSSLGCINNKDTDVTVIARELRKGNLEAGQR